MKNKTLLWLILLLAFSQTVPGQSYTKKVTLNFAEDQPHSYLCRFESQKNNGENTVTAIEIYRDTTRLVRYEPGSHCEFIGQVLIVDDPATALKNYHRLPEKTRKALDSDWLNAFQQPLPTGAYVKCWYCMGESVFFLSFE